MSRGITDHDNHSGQHQLGRRRDERCFVVTCNIDGAFMAVWWGGLGP
jgi:hypothetical protein